MRTYLMVCLTLLIRCCLIRVSGCPHHQLGHPETRMRQHLTSRVRQTINETKMVLALRKTTSDPMLILAQMNPLYISSDLQSGVKEMEAFFPPTIEVVEEPDPWAPPPPEPKVYWMDEEENVYLEENKITFDGDIIKGRRLVKLADGTEVEDGEWKPIPKDEPEAPLAEEEMVEAEVEDEDIGLLDESGEIPFNLGSIDEESENPTPQTSQFEVSESGPPPAPPVTPAN